MLDLHPQNARVATSRPERRQYPRLAMAVQIEFRPEGAEAATHAHTTDLSMGGCYVEMNFTLQVGSRLNLVLWLEDEKITTSAVVVTHHPYFGNGIKFVNLAQAAQTKLKQFLIWQMEKPEAALPAH